MRKFAVLTDSACDIPADMQKKYNIDILSFTITVDGESYIERVDFTNEQYYDMLQKAPLDGADRAFLEALAAPGGEWEETV